MHLVKAPLEKFQYNQRRIITVYSEEYEFSAVHEAGHAACAACFPPPSQKEIAEEFAKLVDLPFSHLVVDLPFSGLLSRDAPERLSRISEIVIGYDEENKRYDGLGANNLVGLSYEKQLVITLGGKVAELMARSEGHWDITEIQTGYSNREFDKTQDTEVSYDLLSAYPNNPVRCFSVRQSIVNCFVVREQCSCTPFSSKG